MNISQMGLGDRLKQLREFYGFSMAQLTMIGRVKSSSNINYWEKGDKIPSADNLLVLANLYCVSADWLLGRTNDIYPEPLLRACEDDMLSALSRLDLIKSSNPYDKDNRIFIPETYLNPAKRPWYTVAGRADLVVLYHAATVRLLDIIGKDRYFSKDDSLTAKETAKYKDALFHDLVYHDETEFVRILRGTNGMKCLSGKNGTLPFH